MHSKLSNAEGVRSEKRMGEKDRKSYLMTGNNYEPNQQLI